MSRNTFILDQLPAIPYKWTAGQVVAIGSGSLQSTVLSTTQALVVTVTPTANCWIKVAASPTAVGSTAGNDYIAAGTKWTFRLNPNDKIAVIQDSTAGFLVILPQVDAA